MHERQVHAARDPRDWEKLRQELLVRITDLERENASMVEQLRSVETENLQFAERYVEIEEIARTVRDQSQAAAGVVALMRDVSQGLEAIDNAMDEQGRGNQLVLNAATEMRDLSDQLHQTTREQARGATRVGINVEGVRDAVSTIVEALSAQLTACTEVATAVDEIREGTHAHQGRTQSIDAAISSMLEQANALREEVGRFEI